MIERFTHGQLTVLQTLRDKLWSDAESAAKAGHLATCHRLHVRAMGITDAIETLFQWEMDSLYLPDDPSPQDLTDTERFVIHKLFGE